MKIIRPNEFFFEKVHLFFILKKGINQLKCVWVGTLLVEVPRTRDGILRERREHARGRNLADCGRICGSLRLSVGSNEEMWNKCSKELTMSISTIWKAPFW